MKYTVKNVLFEIVLGFSRRLDIGVHDYKDKSHCLPVLFDHQQCCFSNGTEMYLLVEVWVGLVQSDQRISHLCPFLIVGLLVLVCKAAS